MSRSRKTNSKNKNLQAVEKLVKKMPKNPQKRAQWLVSGVVLLCILGAMVLWVPGFGDSLFEFLGINTRIAVAAAEITSPTKVHVIDIGQGDAVLLEESGEFALIDAGPPEGRDNLLDYLDAVGVKTLRYVFMTHPHADHYAGMQAVIERYTVQNMILPRMDLAPVPTTNMFKNLLIALEEKEVPTQEITLDAEYALGQGTIYVLQDGLATKDNYNLLSPALLFETQDIRFLNTGDAEKANERELLASGENPRADVFLAAHHGSATSNSADFLNAIRPSIVIISCGLNNDYGHPHREPMQAFEQQNATILRTDWNSTVVAGLDEEGKLVYAVTEQPDAA